MSVQHPKRFLPGHAFPWRIEPCMGGVDIVNANDEQVALFEDRADAELVLTAVHNHARSLAGDPPVKADWPAEAILAREA